MFPIKDENPTSHAPVVTVLLILINIGVFVFIQQGQTGEELVPTDAGAVRVPTEVGFTLERAAIPCEVVEGRPLTVDEVLTTFQGGDPEACDNDAGGDDAALFADKNVWLALLVSMFLHGGWLHLGGNMLFLWVFGNNIEDHLGPVRYIVFYLLGGLVASAAHIAVQPASTVPVVGASGAIAAVMGAYLVWFPEAPVRTVIVFFFILFRDIRAKWLLGFWFVSQFFTASNSGVAWVAHVGGFVFGVAIGAVIRASRSVREALWRRRYAAEGGPWDPTGGVGWQGPYSSPPGQRRFGGRP
ncbi:rhomboid family intramembrane serine protease [soil metagenome]